MCGTVAGLPGRPRSYALPAEESTQEEQVPALEGKAIVITGAGRGLGLAYALHAAAEGAAVVVNDVDSTTARAAAERIIEQGGQASWNGHSVRDHESATALIDDCVSRHGRLDGLVNNAGIRPEGGAWAEAPGDVRAAVEINLLGTIFCGIPAMEVMRDQGYGSIVNASSRAQRGIPTSATYAATKGAVASLTYSWAIDMHGSGVRVNAIAPQAGGTGTRRQSEPVAASEPTAEQMAPLVTYLLSDRSAAVTGQVIRLGGRRDPLSVGLMTHPRNGPFLRRAGGWTVDTLADAFDTFFGPRLEPVGAGSMAVAYEVIAGCRVTLAQEDAL
jgi:NAD(P)-dependent dehydrogenase (short-subunit alcohol dehydrogenase family)